MWGCRERRLSCSKIEVEKHELVLVAWMAERDTSGEKNVGWGSTERAQKKINENKNAISWTQDILVDQKFCRKVCDFLFSCEQISWNMDSDLTEDPKKKGLSPKGKVEYKLNLWAGSHFLSIRNKHRVNCLERVEQYILITLETEKAFSWIKLFHHSQTGVHSLQHSHCKPSQDWKINHRVF